jgi:hypothetical protein
MKAKHLVFTVAAVAALAAQAAFDDAEKAAVRKVASAAEKGFAAAVALDGKAVTVLPVKGDVDGYCEHLLIGALVNAGKTCVVSNDEKNDARFRRILEEIKWDERQTTLKSIDPQTADELGHLKSTQILLEARLDVSRRGRKRRAVAELNLLAYAVSTKQYVWTANVAVDDAGRAWPDPADVNVKVEFNGMKDADGVAAIVSSPVRDLVARYGYRVNADGRPDLSLSATFSRRTFDRSGEYLVFNGEASVRLASCSGDGVLYEKTFKAKGPRGLGEAAAERNFADALAGQIAKWLDETLAPRRFFAKHPDFPETVGR